MQWHKYKFRCHTLSRGKVRTPAVTLGLEHLLNHQKNKHHSYCEDIRINDKESLIPVQPQKCTILQH